ncbi:GNAT family N-acetyltransferase [Populibacterium corticicola]|uniref:GNAT family N-acetyltransferase n=1 Tax=Populibacterium corticicola TaxID=1812826 RepID=A0ABW5XEB0_9MICO
MSILIARTIADPSVNGPEHDVMLAVHQLMTDDSLQTLGHTDFVDSPQARATALEKQDYSARVPLVIERDEKVVGYALISMPLKDNKHLAYVDVVALNNEYEIHEFGLEAAEKVAREHGRTVLNAYYAHGREPEVGDPHRLESPTGIGAVDRTDPEVRALLEAGWSIEQTERYSVLDLPVDPEKLAELEHEAVSRADSTYRLVSWQDHSPEEFIDGHAALQQAMSTDVPSAELEIEETVFDAERIRKFEDRIARMGRGYLAVAAQHRQTGELAGFTRVEYMSDRPEVVIQEETLVRAGHRGHRIGMWVKAAMLRQLPEVRPQAARLHTWNAGENSYMLNINVALGFTKRGIESAWQKKLD